MIKKLLVFALCFSLLTASIPTVSAAEPTVLAVFSKKDVTVGETVTLTLSADSSMTQFTALVSSNAYISFLSGVQLDEERGSYFITFNPSEESAVIELQASSKGEGQIYLTDIEYTSPGGTDTMDDMSFGIKVRPVYTPIYTKSDLNNIRNNLSGNYILMNDIVFTEADFAEGGDFYNGGNGWIPIGAMPSCAFEGSFYGNGYTIKGLKINRAYYFYNGLFGVSMGEIEAVRLKNTAIDITQGINTTVLLDSAESQSYTPSARAGIDYNDPNVWTDPNATADEAALNKYDRSGDSNAVAGLICGVNYGTVRECYAEGSAVGNSYIGGIAATNSGTVKNSAVKVNIEAASLAGGIAADATIYSKIYDCVTEGDITATSKGGMLGVAKGVISRAYSLCDNADIYASSTATLTEVYVTDKENVEDITFTAGDWCYTGDMPYPTPIADLVATAFGDVDGSGKTDTTDLAKLKLFLAGAIDDTGIYPDIDESGKADTTDLAKLKLYLAGASV